MSKSKSKVLEDIWNHLIRIIDWNKINHPYVGSLRHEFDRAFINAQRGLRNKNLIEVGYHLGQLFEVLNVTYKAVAKQKHVPSRKIQDIIIVFRDILAEFIDNKIDNIYKRRFPFLEKKYNYEIKGY